jgi:multidrug transporter EmrE-like cation transporter
MVSTWAWPTRIPAKGRKSNADQGTPPTMGYLLLAIALALNATANVLLKGGAAQLGSLGEPGFATRLIGNHQLLGGLALFALNVVFYVAALARLDLSIAYPIMVAGGIVIVVAASVLHLQEAVTVQQLIGIGLLLLGIVLVSGRTIT